MRTNLYSGESQPRILTEVTYGLYDTAQYNAFLLLLSPGRSDAAGPVG